MKQPRQALVLEVELLRLVLKTYLLNCLTVELVASFVLATEKVK
jgi:hypothetical protein